MNKNLQSAVRDAFNDLVDTMWNEIHKEVVRDLEFVAAYPEKGDLILEILDSNFEISRKFNLTENIKDSVKNFDEEDLHDDLISALLRLSEWVQKDRDSKMKKWGPRPKGT